MRRAYGETAEVLSKNLSGERESNFTSAVSAFGKRRDYGRRTKKKRIFRLRVSGSKPLHPTGVTGSYVGRELPSKKRAMAGTKDLPTEKRLWTDRGTSETKEQRQKNFHGELHISALRLINNPK